jgi:hypothetical protein
MARKKEASERSVGRPPMEMPDMIPDTPTNVARKVLTTKPKKNGQWRYQQARNTRGTKNTRK